MRKFIFAVLLFAAFGAAQAQVGALRDSRGFFVYDIAKAGSLFGLEYSGALRVYANDAEKANDFGAYFMRQNLTKWVPYDNHFSFGLAVEYDDLAGFNNDFIRLAPAVRCNIGPAQGDLAYYVYESDQGGQKWALDFVVELSDELHLGGFVDYYIGAEKFIVLEPSIAIHLVNGIWAKGSFQINELYNTEQRALGLEKKQGFLFGLVLN